MNNPKSCVRIIRIGGKAKVEKKAVAPASRSGSFFFNSLTDWRIHFKVNLKLVYSVADLLLETGAGFKLRFIMLINPEKTFD